MAHCRAYANCRATLLPQPVRSPDHHHPRTRRGSAGTRSDPASPSSTGVRFTAGTIVSAGEYRNSETGTVRYFDGNTPLPGGANSASWQQISA